MIADLRDVCVREWMITDVPVITAQTTIAQALRLLREQGAPVLPVVSEGRFVGLVDEKTLLRFTPSEATTLDVYELREVLDKMTVGRVAAPASVILSPGASLEDAAALMLRESADVIPVVEQGRFLGLLVWISLLAAAVGEPGEAIRR